MTQPNTENKTLTESGFEKKGGYASPPRPVAMMPKVPSGPAPGATPASPNAPKGDSKQ